MSWLWPHSSPRTSSVRGQSPTWNGEQPGLLSKSKLTLWLICSHHLLPRLSSLTHNLMASLVFFPPSLEKNGELQTPLFPTVLRSAINTQHHFLTQKHFNFWQIPYHKCYLKEKKHCYWDGEMLVKHSLNKTTLVCRHVSRAIKVFSVSSSYPFFEQPRTPMAVSWKHWSLQTHCWSDVSWVPLSSLTSSRSLAQPNTTKPAGEEHTHPKCLHQWYWRCLGACWVSMAEQPCGTQLNDIAVHAAGLTWLHRTPHPQMVAPGAAKPL